jgi:hypothetical protein
LRRVVLVSCLGVIRVSVDGSLERSDELHPACEATRSVVVGDDAASITLT